MAAADQIVFRFPRDRIKDRSQLIVTARFRDRATDADVIPTNVKYRLDNLNTGSEILDWTTVSTAAEVSITTTPDDNECKTRDDVQRTLLTVAADFDLSTQFTESMVYEVTNLGLRLNQ